MRTNLKRRGGILALVVSMCVPGGVLQGAAAPFLQEQGATAASASDQDYSKNKPYHQGLREGQADKANNKDHSKNRRFKTGVDQKAYEAGYQKGRN